MTEREIFETSKTHLLKQGKKSVNETGMCLYRSEDGCKCAIGVFIPNNEYDPIIDHPGNNLLGFVLMSKYVPTLNSIFDTEEKVRLGRRLQDIHDGVDVDKWEVKLDQFEIDWFKKELA